MDNLEKILTEIAGKNALNSNCKNTQKLCKTINYLSVQLQVQMNLATNDKEFIKESVADVREQAAKILT